VLNVVFDHPIACVFAITVFSFAVSGVAILWGGPR
jgi:hypothetical protein